MSKKNKNWTDEELVEQIFTALKTADKKQQELAQQNPELGAYTAKVVTAMNLTVYGVGMFDELLEKFGIDD